MVFQYLIDDFQSGRTDILPARSALLADADVSGGGCRHDCDRDTCGRRLGTRQVIASIDRDIFSFDGGFSSGVPCGRWAMIYLAVSATYQITMTAAT